MTPQPLPFRAWWPPRKKTKLRRPLSRPATEARGRGREQLGRGRASQPRPLAVDGVGGSIPVPGVVVTKAPKAPAPPISFCSHPPPPSPCQATVGQLLPLAFLFLPYPSYLCPVLPWGLLHSEMNQRERLLAAGLTGSQSTRTCVRWPCCLRVLPTPDLAPGQDAARTVPIGSGAPSLGL